MALDWVAVISCVFGAGACTALGISFLLRFQRYLPSDRPNWRSLHAAVIPRCGGLGLFFGVAITSAIASLFGLAVSVGDLAAPLGGAALLLLVSLRDDWKPLPVAVRLIMQCLATGLVMWSMALPPLIILLTGIGLVWMTNLYNFMDGADGLAGGMAVCGFCAYGLAAFSTVPGLALICFILAGAAAGFLLFNFAPAKVFLGDAGSIPLGFLAGTLGLVGRLADAWPTWFPVIVFSPFIADSTITLIKRAWNEERIWHAHHEHGYQRLIRMGWSHRRVASLYYGLMIFAALGAFQSQQGSNIKAGYITFTLGMVYLCLYGWLEIKWRHFMAARQPADRR